MIHTDMFLDPAGTVRCRPLDDREFALSVDTAHGKLTVFGTWEQLGSLVTKMRAVVDAAARTGAVATSSAAGDSADPPLAGPSRLVEGVPSSTLPPGAEPAPEPAPEPRTVTVALECQWCENAATALEKVGRSTGVQWAPLCGAHRGHPSDAIPIPDGKITVGDRR